jgi:glycosyltransferase involved in cell wall biosynthesis
MVSIIIPCYNQGLYLNDSLQSVLLQSYEFWECIIVDDGSTDNSKSIAELFCLKDNRFRYIYKSNGGLSSARNEGLKYIKGSYVQFLDADDIIMPDKIKLQVNALINNSNASISISNYYPSTENNLFTRYHNSRYLTPFFTSSKYLKELIINWENKLSIPCHCFLFNSDYFIKHNIRFDENLPNHEDWECWFRIFSLNPIVVNVFEELAVYRIRDTAMCSNHSLMNKGFLLALEKQKKIIKDDKTLSYLRKKTELLKYGVIFKNLIHRKFFFAQKKIKRLFK